MVMLTALRSEAASRVPGTSRSANLRHFVSHSTFVTCVTYTAMSRGENQPELHPLVGMLIVPSLVVSSRGQTTP